MRGDTGELTQNEVIARCLNAAFPLDTTRCFAPLIAALEALEAPPTPGPPSQTPKWLRWLS